MRDEVRILDVGIDEIRPHPENPRKIKKQALERLQKSLDECPELFRARPCICSDRTGDNIILGGNMRWQAARALGWMTVPAIIMRGLTEEQEHEIMIKDNGDFGEWDLDALAAWDDLPLADWGVDLPGNWGDELDMDRVPEPGSGSERKSETVCPKCGFRYAI